MLNDVFDRIEKRLKSALPPSCFPELTAKYHEEPRGRWKSKGGVLVAPTRVEEVSQIITLCQSEAVGVVPYAGGTGLVGGQIAAEGPRSVILSLERMNKIRVVYPKENTLVAEAGVILADVQAAAADVGRLFPLSLASEGSARIGGLLGTNAGGVNVLRYGNARALCLGLEVVLPDGSIWQGLSRLRKDNTGYDLRNLLIGSEGTLGVITAASLVLHPRPVGESTALMVVKDPRAALSLLALARDQMAEGISAFELIHRQGLDFLAETLPDIRQPFDEAPEWMVLVDVGLPRGIDPGDALEALFAEGMAQGLVTDGLIAQSQAQRAAFWAVREQIPEANRRIGSVSSHDISLPLSAVPDFIEKGREQLGVLGDFRINCFGHLGDGNLHYNVFPQPGKTREDHLTDREKVKETVHDLTHEMGGSVSAEHGIGRWKVSDLERYGAPSKLAAMRTIKDALDPAGIMNPGAVLRSLTPE